MQTAIRRPIEIEGRFAKGAFRAPLSNAVKGEIRLEVVEVG